METDTQFDDESLKRIERILLDHPVARDYFQGVLYDRRGERLGTLQIVRADGDVVVLDESTAGRLFMIPDDSQVWAFNVWEVPGWPAGLEVHSKNPLNGDYQQNSVVAFKELDCASMWLDALEVRRMMLAPAAPKRLVTVAFGLMAITAYRLGFSPSDEFRSRCAKSKLVNPARLHLRPFGGELVMEEDKESYDRKLAEYKISSAKLRAKMAAEYAPLEGEVLPINGVLHLSLGEPISKERRARIRMRVEPCIDIPEVRQYSIKSE